MIIVCSLRSSGPSFQTPTTLVFFPFKGERELPEFQGPRTWYRVAHGARPGLKSHLGRRKHIMSNWAENSFISQTVKLVRLQRISRNQAFPSPPNLELPRICYLELEELSKTRSRWSLGEPGIVASEVGMVLTIPLGLRSTVLCIMGTTELQNKIKICLKLPLVACRSS
jgi:hypothetical protein